MVKRLPFNPARNGWHFPNSISTDVVGLFRTEGLCGGMCLSAFNYYRYGLPIPALRREDLRGFAFVNPGDRTLISVPTNDPGRPHPVFDFILHSQLATFQSPNIVKQMVAFPWDDTEQNHYRWSMQDEFPQIKRAIDNNQFVILGLRSPEKGNLLGHQTLVYGYDDNRSTLFMYDPNHPDEEVRVFGNGTRLEFAGPGLGYSQYRSYYVQIILDPKKRTNHTTYDILRNNVDNFSVKPTYVDQPAVQPSLRLQAGVYKIQSMLSGKVLDVDLGLLNLGGHNNGAPLQQWDSRGTDNQKFRIEPVAGGYYKIAAMHSNKVLDVSGNSIANGAQIHQWDYVDQQNAHFKIEPVAGSRGYKIVGRISEKALELSAPGRDNGVKVKQRSFTGAEGQQWILHKIS